MYNILVSVLTGMMISCLIFYLFFYNVIYRGPNSNQIRKNIYYIDDKYYMLQPVVVKNTSL
jgi:hypothetical protein